MSSRLSPLMMAGVGLIACALVLSIITLPLTEAWTKPAPGFNDPSAVGTYSVQVFGADAEGNYMSIMPFALYLDTVLVDHIVVVASWTVTGEEVDWSTLEIDIDFEIRLVLMGIFETYHSDNATSTEPSGSASFDVYASDLAGNELYDINDGDEHNLNVWIKFTASIEEEWTGTRITDDDVYFDEPGMMVRLVGPDVEISGTGTYSGMDIIAFSSTNPGLNPIANPAMAVLVVGVLFVIVAILPKRR